MRILLANKFFYDHGGPESVLFATRDLLAARGHDVIDFAMQHPDNRPSPYAAYFAPYRDLRTIRPSPATLGAALNFVDSREAARCLRRLVRDHRPDVAHLHSINHQITPSIIRALRDEGVPVVMTLHDYKLVCPAYTLRAHGAICERCSGGRFYRAATTRCRGLARGVLLSAESYVQHRLLRSYEKVRLFLSPSRFLAEKFREMGFPYPVEVLPNPAVSVTPAAPGAPARRDGFVFVGRVAEEKGVATLCEAASLAGVAVRIVGDGPALSELQTRYAGRPGIEFLGRRAPAEAQALMRGALAVVVPSEWYENQPMVVIEAFVAATPVIGSRLGGIPELVRDGETGLLYDAGNIAGLASKLRWAREHPGEMAAMGERARAAASDLSLERHYERLLSVYERVLAQRPAAVSPAEVRA
ncbi:MAG TPA: glycosyltransferase [Dehalococcoidia bacterium]|nr:glycosyltransferase [Dehalococcoidia bacterium]